MSCVSKKWSSSDFFDWSPLTLRERMRRGAMISSDEGRCGMSVGELAWWGVEGELIGRTKDNASRLALSVAERAT